MRRQVQILLATVVAGVQENGGVVEPVALDPRTRKPKIVVVDVEDDVAQQLRAAGKGRILRREGEEGELPPVAPLPLDRVPGAAKALARMQAEGLLDADADAGGKPAKDA